MQQQSQINQMLFPHSFFDTLLDPWSLFRISEVWHNGPPTIFFKEFSRIPKYSLEKKKNIKIWNWDSHRNCVHKCHETKVEYAETTPFCRRKKLRKIIAPLLVKCIRNNSILLSLFFLGTKMQLFLFQWKNVLLLQVRQRWGKPTNSRVYHRLFHSMRWYCFIVWVR